MSLCCTYGTDCLLRIGVDDGSDKPPYMQDIVNYAAGTQMFRVVTAVSLVSNLERDKHGALVEDADRAPQGHGRRKEGDQGRGEA